MFIETLLQKWIWAIWFLEEVFSNTSLVLLLQLSICVAFATFLWYFKYLFSDFDVLAERGLQRRNAIPS